MAIVTACGASSTPAESAAASESGAVYTTSAFSVPFEVTVPDWLAETERVDETNFVTWEPAALADPAVRFLVPTVVYAPGSTETSPTPDDYLAYLLEQEEHGATFTDQTETTIGGYPATIVTASIDGDGLNGSLGCPEEGIPAEECFGLQSELTLRIAVIDAGDTTVLAWVRHSNDAGEEAAAEEFANFEEMLATLQFQD
jgi:hypothetical protein